MPTTMKDSGGKVTTKRKKPSLTSGLVGSHSGSRRLQSDDFRRKVGIRSSSGPAKSSRRYARQRGDT